MTLGCVFPADQSDFLAGHLFDVQVRHEVHAPVNVQTFKRSNVTFENETSTRRFLFQSDLWLENVCQSHTQWCVAPQETEDDDSLDYDGPSLGKT